MNPLYLNVALFTFGWLLFVLLQAQNSARSKSNGLAPGLGGILQYVKLQAVNLLLRAFLSGVLYTVIVQTIASKLQSAGFTLHSASVAGIAGLGSNAVLYQIFGLLPWLRVEMSDAAPPANSQILTPAAAPPEVKP